MSIDQFVSELAGGNTQDNSAFVANESERDGNSNDLLFFIDQPTLSIAGGKTFTNLSPSSYAPISITKGIDDLLNGKFNWVSIVMLAVAGFAGYWLLKK